MSDRARRELRSPWEIGLFECVKAVGGAKKGLYASGAGIGEGMANAAGIMARRAKSFILMLGYGEVDERGESRPAITL